MKVRTIEAMAEGPDVRKRAPLQLLGNQEAREARSEVASSSSSSSCWLTVMLASRNPLSTCFACFLSSKVPSQRS